MCDRCDAARALTTWQGPTGSALNLCGHDSDALAAHLTAAGWALVVDDRVHV